MSLTITVTLDDSDVAHFLELFNQGNGHPADKILTEDALTQNTELQTSIGEDMLAFWFENLAYSPVHPTTYDLYEEFVATKDSGDEVEDDYDPCAHLGENMEY